MKKTKIDPQAFWMLATPFGPVAVLWSLYSGTPKIGQILISNPEISAQQTIEKFFPDAVASSCAEIDILVDQMEASLNGADIQFSLDMLRLDLCSPFQQQVLHTDHAIPRGSVSTYRLIAEHIGNPRSARAVGTAQANNPFPIVIPCHRVIRSDSTLGGYGGGPEMKRTLLEREGVAFRDDGRVTTRSIWRF
ncbi:MAG: methylated-DNA--[protein]-cysteine S-methyltransferase [Syntrophus sp. (in: bacteria)]